MSKLTEQEERIRSSTLNRGDIDDLTLLKETLDEGHNVGRADAYALIHEIERLQAHLTEARASRNMLIRQLGKRAFDGAA